MVETVAYIELSTLVINVLLFLKVAAIDQTLKQTQAIDYHGSPTINMLKGLKP